MPRIRTIKPEFFLDEDLFEAERDTALPIRVAYAGLWCHADREGRFEWRPRRLKMGILPYDEVDFERVLDELERHGFIRSYEVAGRKFGVIPTFTRHQVINNRETSSVLPEPPPADACGTRAARVEDASSTRERGDEHASSGEGKGREGKEDTGDDSASPPFTLGSDAGDPPKLNGAAKRLDPHELEFNSEIRPLYPKRDGDQRWKAALGSYRSARKAGESLEAMVAGTRRYAAWCERKRIVGTERVKQAATFFGSEQCWREPWSVSDAAPAEWVG